MTRIALIYGLIAGAITITVMSLGIHFSGGEGAGASQVFGYLVMLVALSLIFIGVKRYRDRDLGGVIKFGPAFLLGLSIAATAGLAYVIGWEIYLALTDYAFMAGYTEGIIEAKREAGVSGAELDKVIAEMEALQRNYANPVFRMPLTFMEIFPVGLLVALLSAALLRNPKVLPARS